MKSKALYSLSSSYKDGGLDGFLKHLELISKRKRFVNLILNLDKKYFVLSSFLKDLSKLEKGMDQYGTKSQAAKFVTKLKLNTAVYSDISNKNFPYKKGLLIYGINHNASIEPIILFSLLNQKRIKLVLYRMFCFLGKNIQKHSLPVAAKRYSEDGIFSLKRLYDISREFREAEKLSDSDIINMNKQSIKKASKYLESGGTVIIFPGGGGDELKKWRFGISRIILGINKEKRHDISLLPVYFSGLGYRGILLRIYKAYKNIRQNDLRVGVYFGKEKTIADIYKYLGNKINEASILDYLKKDAFSQYGLKEFPFKIYLQPKNFPLAISRSVAFLTKLFIQILPFRDFFRGLS